MNNVFILNSKYCQNNSNGGVDVQLDCRFEAALTKDRIETLKPNLNIKYIPKVADKLFFLPGVSIPRVKLKQLILDYNIKIVRDIKEATAVFGNKHFISKMTKTRWYHTIPVENFKECFTLLEPHMDAKDIESINMALDHYQGDTVYSDWSSLYNFCNEDLNVYKNQIVNSGLVAQGKRSSVHIDMIHEDYVELINDLEGITVYNEADLIGELNGDDAILIDEEVFQQLSEMFRSSDTDNHVVAMEIMANSRYKESLLYLHIIFKEFYNVINNSSTKNHVNFKSLLSYLGKEKYGLASTLDGTVEDLKRRGVLTAEALDYLLNRYSAEILDGGDSACFKVKNITVAPEFLDEINQNYVFNIVEDYIPTISAEIDEEVQQEIDPQNLQWL
jgi:hypothetical protein